MSNINQEIVVFNKNKEVLARFTKEPPIESSNKIKMMIDPTVSITQNGESTFTFSINSNSQKWKDIENPENIYLVNGREYTAISENSFVYNGSMVNVSLVETWYLLSRIYVQAYNVPADREGIDEHSVVILPKSTEPLIVNGVRYNNNPYPRGSAGYALWALLQGSGWKLGTCDVIVDGFSAKDDYGVFNLETDQKDLLHNIQLVQELWGGILVWDSVNKTLHLRDENKWNIDNGYEIREGKNLKSPVVITQNNDIITRLYPLGEAKLNIKAVNNNKTYLENFSYTNKVYSRILQNSNIYDQKQLKFWGERKLAEMCKPGRFITAELFDIRTVQGMEHEVFDLNDIATIIYTDRDTGKETKEKQRIIKWTYNVFSPENGTIELGDRTKNIVEIIKQAYDDSGKADDSVNDSGNISGDNIWDRNEGTNLPGLFHKCYKYIYETEHRLEIRIDDVEGSLADFIVEANEKFATIVMLTEFKTEVSTALAGLRTYVDDTFATIESFTKFQTATTQSITSLKQTSDANTAAIELNAQHISENGESIASLELIADDHGSKIEANADDIVLNAKNIKLNAEDIVTIDGTLSALSGEFTTLKADVSSINQMLGGIVIIDDLRVGRLVVDSISGFTEDEYAFLDDVSGSVSIDGKKHTVSFKKERVRIKYWGRGKTPV